MKKPSLKVTKFDGLSPVEGVCTSCPEVSFRVMFPERIKRAQDALNELEEDFYRHVKKAHMSEDANRAAPRFVRDDTESK